MNQDALQLADFARHIELHARGILCGTYDVQATMRPYAVVLFTGDARREEAEKGLPGRFLARLHDEVASIVRSVNEVDLYLASDPGETFVIEGPAFTSRAPQRPLGEKVDLAISRCFAAGYARVAVVAGDVAGLTRELLTEAFAGLAGTTSVLGRHPARGFFLPPFPAPPSLGPPTPPSSRPPLYHPPPPPLPH